MVTPNSSIERPGPASRAWPLMSNIECLLLDSISDGSWPNSAVCLPERIILAYAPTECRARSSGPRAGCYCAISKTSREKPSPEIGDEPFLLPYQITSLVCTFVGALKAAPYIQR
jgi:hypothetical protein